MITDLKIEDFMLTSLESVLIYYPNTMTKKAEISQPTDFTLSNSQDNVTLNGKNGVTIGTLKRNKAATLTCTNGIYSAAVLATSIGESAEHGHTLYPWTDVLLAKTATETSYVAVGTAGSEIGQITVYDGNTKSRKAILKQNTNTSSGNFTYDPATKALVFNAGDVATGDALEMTYNRYVEADIVRNESDVFAEPVKVIANFKGEDQCKNVKFIQFEIKYADPTGNFDIAVSDQQTMQNFEATCLADTCSRVGSTLWEARFINDNTPDVAYP